MKEIKYTRNFIGKDGQERKEYILVGYLFEKDGKLSILMRGYINPAALQNDKGEVWLNVFEHKAKEAKTQDNVSKTLYKGAETVKSMAAAVNQEPSQEPKMDEADVPF